MCVDTVPQRNLRITRYELVWLCHSIPPHKLTPSLVHSWVSSKKSNGTTSSFSKSLNCQYIYLHHTVVVALIGTRL